MYLIDKLSPLISVIIPVFNSEVFLIKCIESVLQQNYVNFELLLINDGSTDGSSIICDNYATKYNNVRTFHKDNGGPASARNFGINEAIGDFITFIDADDWVDKDYLSSFVMNIQTDRYENLILQGLINEFSDGCRYKCNDSMYFAAGCGNLFNRKVIVENKLQLNSEMKLGEDTLFNLEYLKFVNGYTIIDKYGYHYRHSDNGTSLTSSASIESIYNFYLCLNEKLKENHILDNSNLLNFLNSHINAQFLSIIYHLNSIDLENRKKWIKLLFNESTLDKTNILIEEINKLEERLLMKQIELIQTRKSKAYKIGKSIIKPLKFFKIK